MLGLGRQTLGLPAQPTVAGTNDYNTKTRLAPTFFIFCKCVSEKIRGALSIPPSLSPPLKLSNAYLIVEAIDYSVFSC